MLYVSPLKALSADIHKNLAEPRRGIRERARRAPACRRRAITAAVRTGDTTPAERAAMLRTPPHILVTTPESLYLLLTSERSRADAAHGAHGHRRRDPRGDRHAARRAPGALARAPAARRRHGRCCASACRRRRSRSRRSRASCRATERRAAARSSTTGIARRSTSAIEMPRSPLDAVMAHEVWERVLRPARRADRSAPDHAGVRQHAAAGRAARAPSERPARRRAR